MILLTELSQFLRKEKDLQVCREIQDLIIWFCVITK
jgi:hypothetical protein